MLLTFQSFLIIVTNDLVLITHCKITRCSSQNAWNWFWGGNDNAYIMWILSQSIISNTKRKTSIAFLSSFSEVFEIGIYAPWLNSLLSTHWLKDYGTKDFNCWHYHWNQYIYVTHRHVTRRWIWKDNHWNFFLRQISAVYETLKVLSIIPPAVA